MEKLVTLSILFALLPLGESRELRPTEHGLPFQNLPATSPEMMSFFGEQDVLLPPPQPPVSRNETMLDTRTWLGETPGKRKESKMRKALLIATVVCGGTGVVLLLGAAVLFAVHFFKRRSCSELTVADNNATTVANLQSDGTVETVVVNK